MANNTSRDWTPADRDLPPEGVVVEAASAGGRMELLVRVGRLWFLPDRSMYVYWTPAYWRLAPCHN